MTPPASSETSSFLFERGGRRNTEESWKKGAKSSMTPHGLLLFPQREEAGGGRRRQKRNISLQRFLLTPPASSLEESGGVLEENIPLSDSSCFLHVRTQEEARGVMEEAIGGVQEEAGGNTCNFPSVTVTGTIYRYFTGISTGKCTGTNYNSASEAQECTKQDVPFRSKIEQGILTHTVMQAL
jgi:hypothetical protein